MIEFVEYNDDKIQIKLPKQMRQKGNMRFFQGNLVRGKPESQVIVAIDIDLNESSIKVTKKLFKRNRIIERLTSPKGFKVLRVGKCSYGDECMERATSSEIFDKGYTLYTWDVLICLQGRYIMLGIMGGDSLENFESMVKEIITSLKLISPSQSEKRTIASTESKIKRIKRGGLKAKDKARLASVLESLPEDLRYLREPILAIADEDQDMLGSGGVDTNLLAKAIEQQAATQPKGFAAEQSKKLEKWLKSNTSETDTWAGPAWFVMAFLTGYDMFVDKKFFDNI